MSTRPDSPGIIRGDVYAKDLLHSGSILSGALGGPDYPASDTVSSVGFVFAISIGLLVHYDRRSISVKYGMARSNVESEARR